MGPESTTGSVAALTALPSPRQYRDGLRFVPRLGDLYGRRGSRCAINSSQTTCFVPLSNALRQFPLSLPGGGIVGARPRGGGGP